MLLIVLRIKAKILNMASRPFMYELSLISCHFPFHVIVYLWWGFFVCFVFLLFFFWCFDLQFPPTATLTPKTFRNAGFYGWDVPFQPWLIIQILDQTSLLQRRLPLPPSLSRVPYSTFSWLPVLFLCRSPHSYSKVYFCDYVINV